MKLCRASRVCAWPSKRVCAAVVFMGCARVRALASNRIWICTIHILLDFVATVNKQGNSNQIGGIQDRRS